MENSNLERTVERFFEKLEKYYPERKVFALDSIDRELRKKLSELYKKKGYPTVDSFLHDYGFKMISGKAVTKLRRSVVHTPGNEPEIIKSKVDSMLRRLQEYYPERKILRGIQNDHKKLSQTISGLYQWLGYSNASEMLKAYGYETLYEGGKGGRPRDDYQETIEFLKGKYIHVPADNMKELMDENPEIRGKIKTIQNKANELFSMSFAKYLQSIGVLKSSKQKKGYSYVIVSVEGLEKNVLCSMGERTIKQDSIIEMYTSGKDEKVVGRVVERCFCTEEELPIPCEDMYQYIRKVDQRELDAKMYHYLIISVDELESNIFCAIDKLACRFGSYVEICKYNHDKKVIGRVVGKCSCNDEELPIPYEDMYQFIRRVSKQEYEDIKASKEQYILCSVKIEGRTDALYYISPFEYIQVGDVVKIPHPWNGTTLGVVKEIQYVSEKTSPYSVKKSKSIIKVVRGKMEELDAMQESVKKLCSQYGTKELVLVGVKQNIVDLYERMAYFSGALFRGLDIDVRDALVFLYPNEINPLKHRVKLENGFSQFECNSANVPQIVKRFPNLKALFFAEDWKNGKVYLAYSESGYCSITELRLIGNCDFYCRDRWTLLHDPSEEHFEEGEIKYSFYEREKWEKCNYVLPDSQSYLAKETLILSRPCLKENANNPRQVIKIQFPIG